jgi:bifunctional oligoribonuclease and PAP phosphatase NrnA
VTELAEVAARLAGAQKVLLTCHLGPDGDSLGSMSALEAILAGQGKQPVLFNPDGVPRHLKWLPGMARLVRSLPGGSQFDVTVVVDCGDRKLLGQSFPGPAITGPVVVIDHHLSSRPFGDLYFCDPAAASVGVLVARLATSLGWPIGTDAATAIYTSLVADTGSFRYSNSNAEAFSLAARLVGDEGVDPWAVAQHLGEEVPLARYRLLGLALAAIKLELGGQAAVLEMTEEMVRTAGAKWEHTDGLVNYARGIEGVEVGVLLAPLAQGGGTRISLRSKGRLDCGAVCAPFGGGGHRGAAGCAIAEKIPEARTQMLAAIEAALAAA